jgi:hypothetical protein
MRAGSTGADGAPVVEERADVGVGAERGHLVAGHRRAEVAPARADAPGPAALVEDLGPIVGEGVHPDVLGPGHVPEEPRDRVLAARARPELGLAELDQQAVGHRAVKGLVPQQEELGGVHVASRVARPGARARLV